MINSIAALADYGEALHERQRWRLPAHLQMRFEAAIEEWRLFGNTRRLWEKDASLWTGQGEDNWLGWLTIAEEQLGDLDGLLRALADIDLARFEHVLLLGMGGSSLCPEVLGRTFGKLPLHPQMLVLDSTDPAQIRRFVSQIDFDKTLFIVSSKSGTTLEPNILKDFFFVEAKRALGKDDVGDRFIAVTDPGSELQRTAEAEHFRHVFFGSPNIGGRFSALSNFGMVPAALMGLDIGAFLTRALDMVHACGPRVPLEENPGILLGLLLGVASNHERDKITLVISPGLGTLGAWIEQLLAKSTGKKGKGLFPVNEEDLGAPGIYGQDRLFCYLRNKHAPDPVQDAKIDALEEAGRPVVRIDFHDKYDLGQEFFRWQIATATAGALLGINPFDQPDVEASKVATRQLMEEFESRGALLAESPLVQDDDFELYADPRNAAELTRRSFGQKSVTALLDAHLQRLDFGNYFALLAFMDMNDGYKAGLQAIRNEVCNRCHVATSLGFGPRYLHSTGQIHKGGPNTGVFLEVTCEDPLDLPVPGRRYTFGIVEAAQARGDFNVLAERGRRVLRVHIRSDPQQGLTRLHKEVAKVLR